MPPLADEHAVAIVMLDRSVDAALDDAVGDERARLGLRGAQGGGEQGIAVAQAISGVAAHPHCAAGVGDDAGVGEDLEEARHALAGPAVTSTSLSAGMAGRDLG